MAWKRHHDSYFYTGKHLVGSNLKIHGSAHYHPGGKHADRQAKMVGEVVDSFVSRLADGRKSEMPWS